MKKKANSLPNKIYVVLMKETQENFYILFWKLYKSFAVVAIFFIK